MINCFLGIEVFDVDHGSSKYACNRFCKEDKGNNDAWRYFSGQVIAEVHLVFSLRGLLLFEQNREECV